MNKPEIFESKAITIHLCALLIVISGSAALLLIEESMWLIWVIMPAGFIAVISCLFALPIAVVRGWNALKQKRYFLFVQSLSKY